MTRPQYADCRSACCVSRVVEAKLTVRGACVVEWMMDQRGNASSVGVWGRYRLCEVERCGC